MQILQHLYQIQQVDKHGEKARQKKADTKFWQNRFLELPRPMAGS